MAFFRNNAVNLLNLHFAVHAAAMYGGGAFFTVYLLKSGISVPGVLAALAAILAGRFIIRPLVLVLAVRWGIRWLLIAGTVLTALQFPLLAEVNGIGPALFALLVVAAISNTFYWTTYHAYFAALGDHEHRGHQLGVREAIGAIVSIASPLATGWALVTFGPRLAFGATAVIQLLAALPLAWTPDVVVARHAPGAFRAALSGLLLFFADGWIAAGYVILWQIALFVSLGENFLTYGGALAMAAFVGAVGGMLLGRHIDAGHGSRAVWLAFAALALTIALRAAAPGHAALALGANALGALVACLYTPTLMTAVYNMAKRSPCPLRFHIATEGGWDAGGASGCLTMALLVSLGIPVSAGILLSLGGALASFVLLRRYYAALWAADDGGPGS